jgi:hypothetical protein
VGEIGTIARIRTNAAALTDAVGGATPFKHKDAYRLFLAAEARRMRVRENPVVCGLALRECLTDVVETTSDPRLAGWSRDLLKTDLMSFGQDAFIPARAYAARLGLDSRVKLAGAVALALLLLLGAGRFYTLRISQLGSMLYVHDTLTRATLVCGPGGCSSAPAEASAR